MSRSGNRPLRLVLLGLPRAGKSGLLAALDQVQQSQPALLPGPLEDPSGSLGQLREEQYGAKARQTELETISYPIRLGNTEIELIDCDGRIAVELLKKRLPLSELSGPLPSALAKADALLLVTDASLKPEYAERVLSAFDQFLRLHEQTRSKNNEVVGCPVFLVLTKCDLLGQEKDGFADWMRRIEEEKRKATRRLGEFLAEPSQTRASPFGRLAVHLWATAMHRPALGTAEARPLDPYGVAELFRQCVAEASSYRKRQEKSGRRLEWTVQGVGAVALGLATITAVLFASFGRQEVSDLQRRVDRYRSHEAKEIKERLHDYPKDLDDRFNELGAIIKDADFETLSEDSRDYVMDRWRELRDYRPYLAKILAPRFSTLSSNEEELRRREAILLNELKPPREEWNESGAGKLRQRYFEDLVLLRKRADQAIAFYRTLYGNIEDLRSFRSSKVRQDRTINWSAWQDEVEKYERLAAEPPEALEKLPSHSLVTPLTVLRMDRVRDARAAIYGSDAGKGSSSGVLHELSALRDLASALELVDRTPTRPALLRIPRDVTEETARTTWRRLGSPPEAAATLVSLLGSRCVGPLLAASSCPPGYPPYWTFDRDFRLERVPLAARPEVVVKADGSYRALRGPLAQRVRRRFEAINQGTPDTRAQWLELARWLDSDPIELRAFSRLARVVDRLRRTGGEGPVEELSSFLKTDEYILDVKGLSLVVPFDAGFSPLDTSVLTIKAGGRSYGFPFAPRKTKRDGENLVSIYSFPATARLILKAGEPCEATLTLRGDRSLFWKDSRTRTFAFECLWTTPRLHEPGDAEGSGSKAEGVILRIDADTDPRLPDLLPSLPASRLAP